MFLKVSFLLGAQIQFSGKSLLRQYVIVLFDISGALEIPKGRRFMKYLPKGVMNVVNLAVSGSSGVCQKPEATFNLENTEEYKRAGVRSHQH